MRADNESLVDLDELASLLQRHEGPPHAQANARARRPRRTPRLRRGIAIAAAALLAGSGLGFGIASSITPESTAGTSLDGLGFIPLRGWTVAQEGTAGPTGTATAIAANVRLRAGDGLRGLPRRTLATLPAGGALIHATFSPRGDPEEDVRFPARSVPLNLADAESVPAAESPIALAPRVSQQRLRAGVSGYNVDVRIFFGRAAPSQAMLAAAQRQLGRLVVAAEQVTIFARKASPPQPRYFITVSGTVDNGRPGELVDIQAKDCGSQFFHGVAGATTTDGGRYEASHFSRITTTLRAVWNGTASAAITVPQAPQVAISKGRRAGRFTVSVRANQSFWKKRVQVQRRVDNSWKTVKTVVLTETGSYGDYWAPVKLSVRKGTLLRAFVPRSQTRPCYIPGASTTLRT